MEAQETSRLPFIHPCPPHACLRRQDRFVRSDHFVHERVPLFINDPSRRIGVVPGDDFAGAKVEWDGCDVAGHGALYLGVIEQD